MPKLNFTSLIQWSYSTMAPINMEWEGRNTPEGQALLAAMRDFIAAQSGSDSRQIQDFYSEIIRA